MFRQHDDRFDRKRVSSAGVPKGGPRAVDMIGQKLRFAFGKIDGEELAAVRNEVAAIVRHGGRDEVMGFARAQPTLPDAIIATGHVWTAPAVQEESDYQRSVRVRSCIRPLSATDWPLALM